MSSSLNHIQPQQCHWHSYASSTELEQTVVREILHSAQRSISQRGAFHIVLAGGSSPRRIYEILRNMHADWAAWHIYIGDERCLPSGHAERNSRMAALAWLDHVAIPAQQIHFIPAELGAEVAASRYAQIVNRVEQFDLVLLGLGEDGHTASLFPEHDWGTASGAPSTLVIHDSPKPPSDRVSLSAHRLSTARQVIFLVTGEPKRQAVTNWRNGVGIPAASITPPDGVEIYIEAALLTG